MTRIVNDPQDFREEWLAGFVAAYPRYVEAVPGASGVRRSGGARVGKVGVIVGGGCGHYPAFAGLVGDGFADGAVVGDIFTSPSAEQAYRVGRGVDAGAGVLFSFGNYAGDVMNFGVAQKRLEADGIDARIVLVTDDVASAPAEAGQTRRGIAGGLVVFKAAGAASARGADLAEVERVARLANDRTRTFGAAFAGCTFPGRSEPLFTVPAGKIELGLGIHGEPGIETVPEMSGRELAAALVAPLLAERPAGATRAAVVLNGLGATKYEELFVLYRDIAPALAAAGVEVVDPEVGEFVTSLDMAGCSLTLCWLDDELAELWQAPADTPTFRRSAPAADRPVDETPADGAAADPARRADPARTAFEIRGHDDSAPAAAPGTSAEAPAPPRAPAASAPSRAAAVTARAILGAMLATVTEHEDELGRIDAVAGDGDHGTGMTRGLRAAVGAAGAPGLADAGIASVLRAAGRGWADRAGGTSGVLWGLFLETAGQSLSDGGDPGGVEVAAALRAGCEAVMEIGRARAGDKTLLDALIPFVDSLESGTARGQSLPDAWERASQTATEAAAATADLLPKVGRARPLAEKSRGTPDAGATSLAMCAAAAAVVLQAAAATGSTTEAVS